MELEVLSNHEKLNHTLIVVEGRNVEAAFVNDIKIKTNDKMTYEMMVEWGPFEENNWRVNAHVRQLFRIY